MTEPLPILIDTDPAIGLPGRDVDDGLALLQACRHPGLAVRAVTAVFGNAEIDDTYRLAQEVMQLAGHGGVPVARGAAGAHELGTVTPAVELIVETLRSAPHTVVALGPLTNVATALRQAPDIAAQMSQCVFVGGRRPGVEFLVGRGAEGLMDLNFELDPPAAQVLLDSGVPLTYAGFEISAQVHFRRSDVTALAARSTAVTEYLEPKLTAWIDYWHALFSVEYFHPFDTLAIGCLTDPELFRMTPLYSHIEEIDGRFLLHATADAGDREVAFCDTVEETPFRERLLALLD